MVTLVAFIGITAACAPPAPPAPNTTTPVPTTTAGSPQGGTDVAKSYYLLNGIRPRATYTLTFMAGVPENVKTSFQAAAAAVTNISGVTFTVGSATTGKWAATGEMRVRIGALCSGSESGNEAGCAKTLYMTRYGTNRAQLSEISVTTTTSTSNYLNAVTFHELAHAVGLSHFDYRPDAPQIMNPVVNRAIQTYQTGDTEGLRVAGTSKLDPTEMADVFPPGFTDDDGFAGPSVAGETVPFWMRLSLDVDAHQVSAP